MAEGLFERNGILKECLGKTLLGTSWWGGGFSHDGNLRPHRGPDALWEEVDVAVLDAGACQDGCPPQLLLGLQLCRYCRGFLCRSKAKSKEIDPPPRGKQRRIQNREWCHKSNPRTWMLLWWYTFPLSVPLLEVTLVALRVTWRNFVNSAELASEAGTAAGLGGCGGPAASGFSPLPTLPHPSPNFFLLPVSVFFERRKWQMAFSVPILERTNCGYFLWMHPNYVKCSRVTDYCKLRLLLYLFLFMASICPECRIDSSLVPWSHSRDFYSKESRCDDNHSHLKSLAASWAKLSGVRCKNVWSSVLLTGRSPSVEPGGVSSRLRGPVCHSDSQQGPLKGALRDPTASLVTQSNKCFLPLEEQITQHSLIKQWIFFLSDFIILSFKTMVNVIF